MKKLGIGIMVLLAIGCGKNDGLDEHLNSRKTLEFLSVQESQMSTQEKNLTDTSITSYVDVVLKFNQEKYDGVLGVLNSGKPNVKRVAVLGVDSLIYGYADVVELEPNVHEASYYLLSGKMYMKAILKDDKITITETYFDLLSGARPNGWLGRFVGCVERFAHTVTSDPEWGAVFLVGAIYAPEYVLAGLGIGCAIDASR